MPLFSHSPVKSGTRLAIQLLAIVAGIAWAGPPAERTPMIPRAARATDTTIRPRVGYGARHQRREVVHTMSQCSSGTLEVVGR